jgi:hypothetical protein
MKTLQHIKARIQAERALGVMAENFLKPIIDADVEMTKKELTQVIEERLLEGNYFEGKPVILQKRFSFRRWFTGYEDGQFFCATLNEFWVRFFLEKNVVFIRVQPVFYYD